MLVFAVICSVLLNRVKGNNISNVPNTGQPILRLEERWSWGYATEVNETTTRASIKSSSESSTEDPCAPFNLTRPDFSSLAGRISETKCYEYIWEIKYRDEKTKHDATCRTYRLNKGGIFRPNFVIGGRQTEPGEFPHMGAIGWKATAGTWVFKCGSSLISNKYVLTAAHCSRASDRDTTIADPVPQIVRLGDKNIMDSVSNGMSPKDAKIINIIVHPNYSAPKHYFDIALMELEKQIVFTKFIQPACLWTDKENSNLGKKATITGWGVVEAAGRTSVPELHAAVVDIIDTETCDQLLRPSCNRNWCGVRDHQLCAGKLGGGVDACQGDSGGPLQQKILLPITSQGSMHHVVGVTSFGVGCALPDLPGIYTRVSSFIDWIESVVWLGK